MGRRKLQIEPTEKRVRAALHGAMVIDSTSVLLVWEHDHYPQYFVPVGDVTARLEPTDEFEADHDLGRAQRYDVVSPDGDRAEGIAWSIEDVPELAGHVRFEWDALDSWFEEDEVVIVHPRSPYVRVDALHSAREVRVDLGGTTIAHSKRSVMVFETGLVTRFYLPRTDVRLDVLRPSETKSSCPYKGHAEYVSVELGGRLHHDVGWSYPTPLREVAPVAGMIAFHSEKCTVSVDGVRLARSI
ncbi:DUF427 domain-containing protein [Actinospongicola halichondriae]|uniref:DUF427 domain-containing protein n=1 Tax=Actinospongicola halichondriae TaxID=3236844 RepID=UPI003D3ED736